MALSKTAAVAAIALLAMTASAEPGATGAPEPAAAAGPEAAATATIDAASGQLLAVLGDGSLSPDQRLHAIEAIILQRFDLERMSRYVLGRRNVGRLSKEQLAAYSCQFKPYLSRYIGSRFGRYEQEQVEILGSQEKRPGLVLVETRIVGGRFDQAVVGFVMVPSGDEWRAVDASFEGVSVVKNLQAQISDELKQGPDHLLEMLEEKNGERGLGCVES
jgi:ABC-type transporter MlaC component